MTKYGWENSTIPDLRFLLTCLLEFAGFLGIDELLELLTRINYLVFQIFQEIFRSPRDHRPKYFMAQ